MPTSGRLLQTIRRAKNNLSSLSYTTSPSTVDPGQEFLLLHGGPELHLTRFDSVIDKCMIGLSFSIGCQELNLGSYNTGVFILLFGDRRLSEDSGVVQ